MGTLNSTHSRCGGKNAMWQTANTSECNRASVQWTGVGKSAAEPGVTVASQLWESRRWRRWSWLCHVATCWRDCATDPTNGAEISQPTQTRLTANSQRRRSVIKYGGQGQPGQAIKLFQITPYVNDFQTLGNPSSCRRLKKLVLPSIFDTSLSSLTMWNLQSYPTTVMNERMWHFRGVKGYVLSGGQDPNPHDLRPCEFVWQL